MLFANACLGIFKGFVDALVLRSGRGLACVCLLGFFQFCSSDALAGINQWTSIGPYGGSISALVVDPFNPATLFAGIGGGGSVYKSIDGGESWNPANTGLTAWGVFTLAIDPSNSATLYAGTGGGVYKTTNGGGSWSLLGVTASHSITTLAIDPSNPATLYAGTNVYGGSGRYRTTAGEVYKSTDGGVSWSQTLSTGSPINALAIAPSNPTTLYVGTGGGVYKSTDGGRNWNPTNTNPTDKVVAASALAIDPSNPATLYAGTSGGVYKSINGGGSWNPTGLTATTVSPLAIAPSNPSTLYAGTGVGVYKSTNSGEGWSPASTGLGLPATSAPALAIDPSNPATLYAGTGIGVYKSTNGGEGWSPTLPASDVRALAIDPSNPATLYAGTWAGIYFPEARGRYGGVVYKSTDGGGSWNPASTGLTAELVFTLAIDPSNPSTLYAGTYPGVIPGGAVLYKSTDSGGSWSPANVGLTATYVYALTIDPSNPAMLYAGTEGGVYKSTNGGEGWNSANTGLTALEVRSLAIGPSNPATLYAGTGGGVYKSTDGGRKWNPTNTNPTDKVAALTLAIDPSNPATLYAGTYDRGVYKSTDGGGSWQPLNTRLTETIVQILAIDPSNPSTFYAGTEGGVFKFTSMDPNECLFAWAEGNHPALFAPSGAKTAFGDVYTYRYFSATDAYLGVSSVDNHVYYMGPDGRLQDEGPLTDWLPKAGCQAPHPLEWPVLMSLKCLFQRAEGYYPNLFSPSRASTAFWDVYTYRYYTATNAYLGVSSADNHVYYQGPDGNLQDEGPVADWLPKAGCQ